MPSIRAVLAALLLTVLPLDTVLAAAGASAPAAPAAETPAAAELERLIGTLEDPAARDRLVADLRALLAAQRRADGKAEAAGYGARFLELVSDRLAALGESVTGAAREVGDPRRAWVWLRRQAEDPARRALWLEISVKLALVVGVGLVVAALVRALLAPPRRRLERREPPTLWVRLPLLAARTFLDLLPIAAFATAAYGTLAVTGPSERVRLVALAAINAVVLARAGAAVMRLAFTPLAPSLRLVSLSDAMAAYVYVWSRRLINVPVYGFYAAQAALELGLSEAGYGAALKLVGLVEALLVFVLVLQNRGAVAAALRGGDEPSGARSRLFLGLRRRLADIWHVLAGLYLVALYGVWALEVEGGFFYVARGTLVTIVVVAVARAVREMSDRGVGRLFRVSDEIRARYPVIEARTNRYIPVVRGTAAWIIRLVALLVVLEAWRIDVFGFFATDFGRELAGRAVSVAGVLIFAVLAWEVISGAITLYLERADGDDRSAARTARLRTLLPLARSALLVVVSVLTALITLSELGLDIGPLLAGAGVVGLAVGFGAQTLVKDVITGAFILVEDIFQVGDFVDLGGNSGTVEAITIRTVRLRDVAGVVHTLPFSEVSRVLNYTKDFSYAVFNIGVAYREDVDEVMGLLAEIGAEVAADPEYASDILEPLEINGLNEFGDSAVVIRARLKCVAGHQWRVRRAFNLVLKRRFDAAGIEIPFPHQTIYFGEDKTGRAPPVEVRLRRDDDGAGGAAPPAPPAAPERLDLAPPDADGGGEDGATGAL